MTQYSDPGLEAMLSDLESDLTERQQSFSSDVPRYARDAVCAFANDLPNHRVQWFNKLKNRRTGEKS
jgi:ATP-dependent DNA helicase RecG